jgi:peptidyl-prolyl cis-trans isomerase SurA
MGRARAVVGALILAAAPARLSAQQAPQLIDRVVAVVGSQPILLSDVQEKLLIQQAQNGLTLPPDSAGRMVLRRQILEGMIDEEVLYQKARRDTAITVNDADVLSKAEDQAKSIRGQYRTEAEFRASIATVGFVTPEEWRRWLTEQQRRRQYQDAYLGKLRQDGKLKPANVTLPELRTAFAEWQQAQGRTQKRPAMVFFKQVVVAPRATPQARAAALAHAESVLVDLRRGADFETIARRVSQDPGSREQGGDLGWFRRGLMVDAFDRVAFNMRAGDISDPVESPFGYHLIKVERVQPGEIKARHILFVPAVDSTNLAEARARADTVATLLRAGANFDSLARLYADTTEQTHVDSVPRSKLPAIYAVAFDSAVVNQVIPPFTIGAESINRTKFVVAILTDEQPERDYGFDDLRDTLRQQLAQQKSIQELLRTLRNQTYVSVRL